MRESPYCNMPLFITLSVAVLLSDKSNDHNYWVYINGRKNGLCYNSEAFLDYLNNVYLKDDKEKARLVQKKAESISPDVPVLFF